MYAGIGLWTALSSVSALSQGLNLSNTIYLNYYDLTNTNYLIDQDNKYFKVQLQQGHCWFCSNLLAAVPLLVHSLGPPQVGKLFNSQGKPYFYQHLPDNLSGEEEPTPSMENNLCPPL